jgi:hypothetical protein
MSRKVKDVERVSDGDDQIAAYSQAQTLALQTICDLLPELIDTAIPKATFRIWHGNPVWFIDDNPVVGYNATAETSTSCFGMDRRSTRLDLNLWANTGQRKLGSLTPPRSTPRSFVAG